MARVVMVHGIGQQQSSAIELERAWRPALAGGIGTSGEDRLARLVDAGELAVEMVFYGDLFLPPPAAGAVFGDLAVAGVTDDTEEAFVVAALAADLGMGGVPGETTEPEEAAIAAALAAEWLGRTVRVERDDMVRHIGDDVAPGPGGPDDGDLFTMGLRGVARSAFGHLARIPWLTRGAVAAAERTILRDLRQVAAYLTDRDRTREIALERLLGAVTDDTVAVVAHSLGSVVAYEACRMLDRPLPLLVTMGSPLGLRTVVYERLADQPPGFPTKVGRWVNVADTDDVVAADPQLDGFATGAPTGAELLCHVVDNGNDPHAATRYLNKRETGAALAAVLR